MYFKSENLMVLTKKLGYHKFEKCCCYATAAFRLTNFELKLNETSLPTKLKLICTANPTARVLTSFE